MPGTGSTVFHSIQEPYRPLEEMRTVFIDAFIIFVRLVCNPEEMVVKESQRTFTNLDLYGYQTDLIVCNQVLPLGIQDSHFVN